MLFQRINFSPSLPCFVFISCILLTNYLISCDPTRQKAVPNIGQQEALDMAAMPSSADVIMREDAEEIFYDMDVGKYEEQGIHCDEAISPENGYLLGGEDTRVGSVIYVKCETGFWLSGPVVMACTVENEVAKWTPDSQRTCNRGQAFFDEDKQIEPLDESDNDLPTRRENNDLSPELNSLPPPFIHRNHRWIPSLHELRQRERDGDKMEEKGLNRLRKEQTDQLPPLCLNRPETGPCHGTFRRYYFNKATMECQNFYYGGCGGNSNNFESINDCLSICKDNPVSRNFGVRG